MSGSQFPIGAQRPLRRLKAAELRQPELIRKLDYLAGIVILLLILWECWAWNALPTGTFEAVIAGRPGEAVVSRGIVTRARVTNGRWHDVHHSRGKFNSFRAYFRGRWVWIELVGRRTQIRP